MNASVHFLDVSIVIHTAGFQFFVSLFQFGLNCVVGFVSFQFGICFCQLNNATYGVVQIVICSTKLCNCFCFCQFRTCFRYFGKGCFFVGSVLLDGISKSRDKLALLVELDFNLCKLAVNIFVQCLHAVVTVISHACNQNQDGDDCYINFLHNKYLHWEICYPPKL